MITKTKLALAAALALTSASAALADDLPYSAEKNAYLRNPNAPVPAYQQYQAAPRAQLFEGRNVGIGVTAPAAIPSELKRSFDRNSADFNS